MLQAGGVVDGIPTNLLDAYPQVFPLKSKVTHGFPFNVVENIKFLVFKTNILSVRWRRIQKLLEPSLKWPHGWHNTRSDDKIKRSRNSNKTYIFSLLSQTCYCWTIIVHFWTKMNSDQIKARKSTSVQLIRKGIYEALALFCNGRHNFSAIKSKSLVSVVIYPLASV